MAKKATKTTKKTTTNKGRFVKKELTAEELAVLEAKVKAFDPNKTPLTYAYSVAKKAIVGARAGSHKGLIKFLYSELKELIEVRNKATDIGLKGVDRMLRVHKYRHHMASMLMEVLDDTLFTVENDGDLNELKDRIKTKVEMYTTSYLNPSFTPAVVNEDLAEIF